MKKRLPHNQQNHPQPKRKSNKQKEEQQHNGSTDEKRPLSPSHSSDVSTLTTTNNHNSPATNSVNINDDDMSMNINVDSQESLASDDDFWSEVLSADTSEEVINDYIPAATEFELLLSQLDNEVQVEEDHVGSLSMGEDMDFWFDVFNRADEFKELPQL